MSGTPNPHVGGVLELNNWLQRRGKHGVVRWVDRMEGSHHMPSWSTQVYVEEIAYGTGYGTTKQAARDDAAWKALSLLTRR